MVSASLKKKSHQVCRSRSTVLVIQKRSAKNVDAIALAAYAEQLLPRGKAAVCCILPHGIVWTHLYTYSLVPIMLRSAKGWDKVATFVTLTMRHKMELVQGRPIATATQHLIPDLAIPPCVCHSNPRMKEIQAGQL